MSGEAGASAVRGVVSGATVVRLPGWDGGGSDGQDINLMLAEKERNDLGNAERFVVRQGRDLMYVRGVGWHFWCGTHWRHQGAEELVKQRAHDTARAVVEELAAYQRAGKPSTMSEADWNDRLAAMLKWSIASGNGTRLKHMVSEAAPYLSVAPELLDADPLVINLDNGTLRLDGSCEDLRPHERDDRLAKIMPVAFDPDATCPTFDRFLREVQPDDDIRQFLQVWSGYCLTGVTSEQKLVFNFGEGGNGKSVFIDLIARMMGGYAVTLPFTSLLRDDRKRGAEATPDLARLPGSRLVRASEPEKGSRFAEATIKAVTGGEEITVRHLNHGFFDFVPQFKLTLSGNHKPVIRGQDRGIWRRFLLVPWAVTIPNDKEDHELPAKLWAERSGVLNWLLDGVRLWLEGGLVVPEQVRAATDDYRADSDPIGRFIADCVESCSSQNVQASAMYDAYKAWCSINAERAWSMTAFGKVLPERGIAKSDGRIRVYMNVRLVNVPESSDEPPPVSGPDDYG